MENMLNWHEEYSNAMEDPKRYPVNVWAFLLKKYPNVKLLCVVSKSLISYYPFIDIDMEMGYVLTNVLDEHKWPKAKYGYVRDGLLKNLMQWFTSDKRDEITGEVSVCNFVMMTIKRNHITFEGMCVKPNNVESVAIFDAEWKRDVDEEIFL